MESSVKKKLLKNPVIKANFISKFSFWFTLELFKKGNKRELENDDLYEVVPEHESGKIGDKIEKEWEKHRNQKNGIYWILWKMFGNYYILLGLLRLVVMILSVLKPVFISRLVSYFVPGQKHVTKLDAYLYSLFLISLQIIDVIFRQNFYFYSETLVIKIRTAVINLLFRKLIKIPTSRLNLVSFGKLTNLITRDINTFDGVFVTLNDSILGFISMGIILWNLYDRIGLPAISAIVIVLLLIPIQLSLGIWMCVLKIKTSKETDKRLATLQEGLSNIRAIKMYVWEKYFEMKTTTARKKEMKILLKLFYIFFLTISAVNTVQSCSLYLVLIIHTWLGKTLDAETIYFISGTFLSLSHDLVVCIPYAVFYGGQMFAAIKRIKQIMITLDEEQDLENINSDRLSQDPKIILNNATLLISKKTIFTNSSVEILKGLTIVTGNSNCGKTVLLMTFLKQFKISEGELVVDGKISYLPQEPWLFPSTIKQNILFGSKFDKSRYESVIAACALQYDFNLLENGDETIVADGGINLSKGQKSRINLARAIYVDSDIYLLDDFFANLDPIVSNYIFNNCILNFLKNKIVVLVSYDNRFAPYATQILKFQNGSIQVFLNRNPEKAKVSFEEIIPVINNQEATEDCNLATSELKPLLNKKENSKKMYSETKKTGSVTWDVYKNYLKLGGGIIPFCGFLMMFVLCQLSISLKEKTISEWANIENYISQLNATDSEFLQAITQKNIIIYKYTGCVLAIAITTFLRAYVLFYFSKKVSVSIHKKMLNGVLKTSVKFFDKTYIGNIINRFSKDLETVDENIPFPMLHLTAIIFETIGNLILISSTDYSLSIVTILLFVCFMIVKKFYLKVGFPLKRLDVSTNSPVIGYFKSTLEGLISIKVFNAESLLKQQFESHCNHYNSASYSHISCLKAYVFLADMLTSIFTGIMVLQFIIFDKNVSPGGVGLAISQAFVISKTFFYAIYKLAAFETQMTSVERALEYTDLKPEKTSSLVLENWPKNATITFQNVHFLMNQNYILKNLNFSINSNDKIGIVGRTGAGKSSIVSLLYQLYDIQGNIFIDEINIKTLSLSFLRSRISIIPQDPMLFDGSLRENLDPFEEFSDDEIWQVLESVHLKEFVPILSASMKFLNFTCGQRQLMCLARVLLKKNKILILDEIIESVDLQTEEMICQVIEKNFEFCTVIKIAHRLKFVMDCHKVMVLNLGEIVEFENPQVLLEDQNSLFYQMVQNSDL